MEWKFEIKSVGPVCANAPSQNISKWSSLESSMSLVLVSVTSSGAHTHTHTSTQNICNFHHSLMQASRVVGRMVTMNIQTRARKTVVSLGSQQHLYPVYHLLFEKFGHLKIRALFIGASGSIELRTLSRPNRKWNCVNDVTSIKPQILRALDRTFAHEKCRRPAPVQHSQIVYVSVGKSGKMCWARFACNGYLHSDKAEADGWRRIELQIYEDDENGYVHDWKIFNCVVQRARVHAARQNAQYRINDSKRYNIGATTQCDFHGKLFFKF